MRFLSLIKMDSYMSIFMSNAKTKENLDSQLIKNQYLLMNLKI
jgi:hypothetical protein